MQRYFVGKNGELIQIVFDNNQLDFEIEQTRLDYIDTLYELRGAIKERLDGLERARLEQDREMAGRENGSTGVQRNRPVKEETKQLKGRTAQTEDGTRDMGGVEKNEQ